MSKKPKAPRPDRCSAESRTGTKCCRFHSAEYAREWRKTHPLTPKQKSDHIAKATARYMPRRASTAAKMGAIRLTAMAYRATKMPEPVPEYLFAYPRLWRFDWAWPAYKVALEIEGGVWSGGRHTRASGFLGDMEKYNHAASLGWLVIRCTSGQAASSATLALVRDAMRREKHLSESSAFVAVEPGRTVGHIVDHVTGCWVWTGASIGPGGYGAMGVGSTKKTMLAHVFYWERAHGPKPLDMDLDHSCRNRGCVNPEHLTLCSRSDNSLRGTRGRLTKELVELARARVNGGESISAVARDMGVHNASLHNALSGKVKAFR